MLSHNKRTFITFVVSFLLFAAPLLADEQKAKEYEKEAEALLQKAKEKEELAERNANMADKLRQAAKKYAEDAEKAQKQVGDARKMWVENFSKALKSELPEVSPKAEHMREMIRIDRKAAAELMQQADVSDWKGNFNAWYELGKDFQRWGNYDSASRAYQQALTQPGGHPTRYTDSCFRWAYSERKAGQPQKAEKPLNILLRRFDNIRVDGVKAQNMLCDLYYPGDGAGNKKQYVSQVHRFLRRYPDQSSAYAELKRMQRMAEDTGDVTGVIQSLDQQIEEAKSPHARKKLNLTRARTLFGSGQYYQALQTLDEFPPSNTEAMILRARCAWKLLDYYAALQYLDQARDNRDYGDNPEKTPPLQLLMSMSQFKTSQEEYTEAFQLLDEARDLIGDDLTEDQKIKLQVARIDVLIAQGDTNSALPLIKELQTDNKGESPYWIGEVQLAKIDFMKERYAEAIEKLKKVADLMDPQSSPRALFWLGKTQLEMGNTEKAVETFRELWSRYGENDLIIQAIYLIGRTYRQRGDFIDAINLFESVGMMRASSRTKVVPGEELVLKVNDPDYAVGTGKDYMEVDVTTTSGDAESVRLKVNPISKGLYVGGIGTELGKPDANSGILELRGDDVITVRYIDQFGKMKVQYEGSEIDMEQNRARPDKNIGPSPGTNLFSKGKVQNIQRLTDKKTEEPAQGFLDPMENESFTFGMRFLRKHLLKNVRIHTGQRPPRKIRIETLKLKKKSEEGEKEQDEWIVRKEINDLEGAGWHEYSIPPTETRAIRLRVLDDPDARGWRQINEWQVIEGTPDMAWEKADIEVGEAKEKKFELYVVDTGELQLSSVGYIEENAQGEEQIEGWQPLATDSDEAEEEKHALDVDVARRQQGVVTPGNTVFAELKDKDLSLTDEPNTVTVQAIAKSIGENTTSIMDKCPVKLTETGPYTGVFRGLVQTAPAGPTAEASDTAEGYSAGAALDEDPSPQTAWQAKPDDKPGKWIKVDLKDLYEISEIRWSRGTGKDDRYIRNGEIKIYGGQQTRTIPINNNTKANDNVVKLDDALEGRYVTITAHQYDGNAPAISQIIIKDTDGNTIVPADTTPMEMLNNDVVDLDVGDSLVLEYLDEENVDPGKPTERESDALDVQYDDADVLIAEYRHDPERDRTEYRETRRIKAGQIFRAMVQDVDEDIDDEIQSVSVAIGAESGDTLTLTAKETEGDSGTFIADVQTSAEPSAKDSDDALYVETGDAVWVNYIDKTNMNPGHTVTRTALAFDTPPMSGGFKARTNYVLPVPNFMEMSEETEEDEEWAGPTVSFSLSDPDASISPFAIVPVFSGARNTEARRIIGVSPTSIDGTMEGEVALSRQKTGDSMWAPKAMSLNTAMFEEKDAQEWKDAIDSASGERKVTLLEGTPLPVLGNDVIFFQYLDQNCSNVDHETLRIPTRKGFQAILEESERSIPPANSSRFLANAPVVELVDPETGIGRTEAKMEHLYKFLMGRRRNMYETMLSHLENRRIKLASRLRVAQERMKTEQEGSTEEGDEDSESLPPEAALGEEETSATAEILTTTEMLSDRLQKIKSDIKTTKEQLTFYKQFKIQKESIPTSLQRNEVNNSDFSGFDNDEGPFFSTPIPGYKFKIQVDDPALIKKGKATIVIRSYLHGLEKTVEKTATPTTIDRTNGNGQKRVLETVVRAGEVGSDADLPVGWGGTLRITYKAPEQEPPDAQLRKSFVAFASDGQLGITQDNFVDPPESLRVGEAINVVVNDPDRDVSYQRDNVLIEATSGVGDSLVLMLTETAPRSGIFRGRIPTQPGNQGKEDASLQVDYGGNLQVQYIDYINLGGQRPVATYPQDAQAQAAEGDEEVEQTIDSCVEVSETQNESNIRTLQAEASFLAGSEGSVRLFARNLPRGRLEKETLFSSGYANYMLGKNFAELGSTTRANEAFATAKNQFEALIRQYPGHEQVAHATFYLGNIEFVQEHFEQAIRYYRNVLQKAPKSDFIPQTRLRMGMAYEKMDQPRKAMEQYAYLTYHHANSPYVKDAMVNLIMYFDKAGQKADREGDESDRNLAFARMVNVAQKYQEKFPDDKRTPRIILRSALRLVKSEQYKRAAEILEEAEEKHAGNTEYMPAYLYWHAEALLKGRRIADNPTERARVLLQRVVYDFDASKYRRYAKARLVEIEE